ncbi:hypothetical protein [Methanogenium sp. MK-MG]|uniref:hypothetical protein n=1 Tax=Methanogenium sp. MK-MG TaxID=2599926 RepID=UPI0013ED134F|nr:hypothetical protein [Methanogenium sp. MK-MG]
MTRIVYHGCRSEQTACPVPITRKNNMNSVVEKRKMSIINKAAKNERNHYSAGVSGNRFKKNRQ